MTRNRAVACVASFVTTLAGLRVSTAASRYRATAASQRQSQRCELCLSELDEMEAALLFASEALLKLVKEANVARELIVSMAMGLPREQLPDYERELLDHLLGNETEA